MVCITGQVPTHLIGNDAFQECDTVGITRPCTKHNYLVKSINDLPQVLHEAFHIAKSGRPGPVVVDIPKDVQFATGRYAKPTEFQHKGYRPKVKGDLDRIKAAVELMAHAKRPLFYTGGGVINSGPEPPASVSRTTPRSSRPSSGVFLPFDRSVPGVTVQVAPRSTTTRSAGSPSRSPGATPCRSPRIRAGPVVSASTARAERHADPASTAASTTGSAVSIPLIPLLAQPNSTCLSTSVWGAWSVAMASAVPSARAARQAAASDRRSAAAGSRAATCRTAPRRATPSVHGSRGGPVGVERLPGPAPRAGDPLVGEARGGAA